MSNGEYWMFLFGFIASAGMFYNVGRISASRKYSREIYDLRSDVARLKMIVRMTEVPK